MRTPTYTTRHWYWVQTTVVALILSCADQAYATDDQPWHLRVSQWQDTGFSNDLFQNGHAIEREEYFAGYTWFFNSSALQLAYAHQPVLIRDGVPAHNGYFHQLDLNYRAELNNSSIAINSGIHGSSNMFKHGDFHRDAWVNSFSVAHQLHKNFSLGLNGDYRFGHFAVYPTLQWQMPLLEGNLDISLPTNISWEKNALRFAFTRYGEKWAALDKARNVESAFYLEEWRLSAAWTWSDLLRDTNVQLGVGLSVDTEINYLDLLSGWIDADLDNAAFIYISLEF